MDLLQRARQLYLAGEMHDALEVAQAACEKQPKDAEGWWLLGCVSRYTDLPAASDAAFKRAADLSGKRPAPSRVDAEGFKKLVDAALEQLSPDARRRLGKTRVKIEPLPALDAVKGGVSPDTAAERRRQPEDVLTIFQVNLENRAGSEAELVKLINRTLARA